LPRRLSHTSLAHLLLLTVVIIWGATFVLVKDALQDASPLLFNLLRMALAFLALAIVNHRQLRDIDRQSVVSGFAVGVFLAAGYQFQTTGLALSSLSYLRFAPQERCLHAGPQLSERSWHSPAFSY
jgi:drug/metabolite transporter (DMT)-like permease